MRNYLLVAALLLNSCAATGPEAEFQAKADSMRAAQGQTPPRKVKAQTIIYQYGAPGATQTATVADNRKAGQRQGAAATAPAAQASNASQRSGGSAWWVYLALLVVGAGLGDYLGTKFGALLAWLPWRGRPG